MCVWRWLATRLMMPVIKTSRGGSGTTEEEEVQQLSCNNVRERESEV